jgi:FAD/FMN-containing dehydrogenase
MSYHLGMTLYTKSRVCEVEVTYIPHRSGTISSVGYVGWSTLGGYGPLSSFYGLGVDQIIGARIVDAQGQIVDANDEVLAGVRGGGGTLGIIVELTIKVYPLEKVSLPIRPGMLRTVVKTMTYSYSHR